MSQEESQMPLPFPFDRARLTAFLTRYVAIENEEDRLRDDKRLLKEEYMDDFPMRGVLTAVKRIRALHKLEAHPKDGMKRKYLEMLEVLVEEHLLRLRQRMDDLMQAIDARVAAGERVAVNMETGEVR